MRQNVGYEIFVESFFDGNNDGIGDLLGVKMKLPYIKSLGVNLIWLTPFTSSGHYDNGYDVSDYMHVDEMYGNDEDLDELIREAHALDIKVVMDLVLNHTSIQHEWFEKSRRRIAPYDSYYIWRDKPNNWLGFCGDAWQYDEIRKQYYFHIFSYQQADLNYQNPLVLEEMKKIMKYYLDKGIDGFRLDAMSHLAKDFSYRNSRKSKEKVLDTSKYSNRKELVTYLKELHDLCKEYDAILIGEVGGEASSTTLRKFTDKESGIIDYAFTFNQCWMNDLYGIEDASNIKGKMFTPKRFIDEYMGIYKKLYGHSHIVNYWLNHDHPRLASQYGDEHNEKCLSMLCGLLYLLPGMPFIYYGEEIGMRNALYYTKDAFHDEYARNCLEKEDSIRMYHHLSRVNRDSARSPMAFDLSKNQGFSKAQKLYRELSNEFQPCVSEQEIDADSVLSFYKKVIALKTNPKFASLYEGKIETIEVKEECVIYYKIKGEQTLEVYANLENRYVDIDENMENVFLSNTNIVKNRLNPYQIVIFIKENE